MPKFTVDNPYLTYNYRPNDAEYIIAIPAIRDDDGTDNILNGTFSVVFANDTLGFYEDIGETVNARYGNNELRDLTIAVKESEWDGIGQSFPTQDWYAIVEYTDDGKNDEKLDTRTEFGWSLPELDPTLGGNFGTETPDDATSIQISSSAFDENLDLNSIIAQISADYSSPSIGSGPPQYSVELVAGEGDTDNDKFHVDSVKEFIGFFYDTTHNLVLIDSADHETQDEYSIRLKTVDSYGTEAEQSFTLTVNDVNERPTDLSLSESNFDENIDSYSDIATLSTSDQDSGDTHTYALVNGDGDTDNSAFTIDGDQIKIVESPDFETKSSYSVRVQTKDSGGLTLEKAFTLTVNDLNEVPTDLSVSASTFDENIAGGSAVATLSTSDPDSGDTNTYSLVSGTGDTDNSAFTIDGDQLKIVDSPDFETKDTYSIRLQTKDSGGLTLEKVVTLTVNDLEDTNHDFNGDGKITVEHDALIGLRMMFGTFPGDALTDGALTESTTTDASEVQSLLSGYMQDSTLDLDSDGMISPFTDGMQLIREIEQLQLGGGVDPLS